MANIKIAQLTNKTTIADTDIVLIESATQTMKMTIGNLKNLLGINEGGIEESGSNSNGFYVKYKDGTMICWINPTSSDVTVTNGSGGGITTYRGSADLTFPTPFLTGTKPSVSFSGRPSSDSFSAATLFGFRIYSLTNATVGLQILSVATYDKFVDLTYQAIGRWK